MNSFYNVIIYHYKDILNESRSVLLCCPLSKVLSLTSRLLWKQLFSLFPPVSLRPLQPCPRVLSLSPCYLVTPNKHQASAQASSNIPPTSDMMLPPCSVPPSYQPSMCRESEVTWPFASIPVAYLALIEREGGRTGGEKEGKGKERRN